MAQWREQRGLTLRLRVSGGRARFVRLTLVERKGLIGGWFNVREARAEGRADPDALPTALGGGRMLSWRPMPKIEADASLDGRRRTLERLGYVIIAASEHAAEPWAWIRDLVHRQLQTPDPEAAEAVAPQDTGVHPLLEPVMAGVGGDVTALIEGFAKSAGISVDAFEAPNPAHLASADADALGTILDALAEAEAPHLRALCKAWLDLPTTAYELDASLMERWLEEGRMPAQRLASRIPQEGLALLGPRALERLARRSRSPRVRQFCQGWTRRFA